MTCTATLNLNPGSDYTSTRIVTNDDGTATDLTGFTAEVLDLTGNLADVGAVAFTITDAAAGEVTLAITWQAAWSALWPRVIGTARLRLINGTEETASFPFQVVAPDNATRIIVPRGGDMTYQTVWPDDSDGADLTGQTVDVINVSAGLTGRVSVAVVDAASRTVAVTIEGEPPLPVGNAGSFQLRRRTGTLNNRTLPPTQVTVK